MLQLNNRFAYFVLMLVLGACGSDGPTEATMAEGSTRSDAGEEPASAGTGAAGSDAARDGAWVTPHTLDDLPPPREGYTRIVAPSISDLPPGVDVEECQWIRAPFDEDVDVLDVAGYQTVGGHHAVLFASLLDEPVGTSRKCTDDDNASVGAFLGGPNGDTGDSLPLPDGVAFRIRKGQSLMVNTHFINVGTEPIDGHTVIDIKFADVDQERAIATLFAVGGMDFEIAPNAQGEFTTECELPERVEVVGVSNHMHDWGNTVRTEVVRQDGEVVVLRNDDSWSYDLQFAAEWNFWSKDEPLVIEAGDRVRASCTWNNTTDAPLTYPREMCFGRIYLLWNADTVPVCLDGTFFMF